MYCTLAEGLTFCHFNWIPRSCHRADDLLYRWAKRANWAGVISPAVLPLPVFFPSCGRQWCYVVAAPLFENSSRFLWLPWLWSRVRPFAIIKISFIGFIKK